MLERLRFPVERSRGRRYPEPEHPYRNAFQRDRDRVVHSRAFRRLEAKTQVFSPGLSDHFRNRLTHTIEVSQIARTVAGVLELDENLTEALALAHDIGHPPFVESFEQRYARFPGLNLTFEVREGMVKHSRDLTPGEYPEFDAFLPGQRPVLEAQLIDLADEVAYNTADLDDAFSAGLIAAEDIAGHVDQYRPIYEAAEAQFPGATARERFQEGLRRLIDLLVSGLIEGAVESAREAGVGSAEDVRACPRRIAAFTPQTAETSRALKRFLYARVYGSPALGDDRRRSMAMVADLFHFFEERPDRLPHPYAEQALAEPAHQVVCDYIAGMTDAFFRRTYEQAMGRADGQAKACPT